WDNMGKYYRLGNVVMCTHWSMSFFPKSKLGLVVCAQANSKAFVLIKHAFLIEEQKIIVKVLGAQAESES
ncbi:hypothetical protein E2I00_009436, partial [Balaenoptera physalus]